MTKTQRYNRAVSWVYHRIFTGGKRCAGTLSLCPHCKRGFEKWLKREENK